MANRLVGERPMTTAERQKRHWQKKRNERKQYMVTIGEAADILGVTACTLRNWDASGKLKPVVTAGGHRRYLVADLKRIVPRVGDSIKFKVSSTGLHVPDNFDVIETYEQLTEYTVAFANGDIGFLLLVGSPGSGKSRQMRHDLQNKSVTWIDNHATNLGLYCAVYKAGGVPIVLDDVNHFISTKISCSLIKSLTQTEEEKHVSWESTSKILEDRNVPREFTTRSPICLIGNRWDASNDDYAAIQDRALPVAFFPSAETIHNRVIELGWCNDPEIIAFIGENLANIPQPSMREYYNAMRYKRAKMDWRKKLIGIWEMPAQEADNGLAE